MAGVTVRRATPDDLGEVERIQALSPEASHWQPRDYLAHEFAVAVCEDRVAGFIVARRLDEAENEILNLAVDPARRRAGIGRRLVDEIRLHCPGAIWLEVRESNRTARSFYQSLGFQEFSVRLKYYEQPPESAIVMKFHSC
jgi:ribosomal-protein-alanine N-acetyltransferase